MTTLANGANQPVTAGGSTAPKTGANPPAPAGLNAPVQPVQQEQQQAQFTGPAQARLVRSNLMTLSDRYFLEGEHMAKLAAGSGPFGTGLIDDILMQRKKSVCKLQQGKELHHNKLMLQKMELDGLYVDDPEIRQKFRDINVQKLEERLLNNGQSEFFKENGELKLDNDLLMDEITRPADLGFNKTSAFQTKEVNAILSDRMNAFKKRYYRLDVIVGKVNLQSCMRLFCEEDRLALKLREQFKDYEVRVSMAMIPFYKERFEFIQQEIEDAFKAGYKKEDLKFLEQNRADVQNKLDVEMKEVQQQADELYSTWEQIKALREKNKFSSSNVVLKVFDNIEHNLNFNLTHEKPSDRKTDSSALPGNEVSRRNSVQKVKAFFRLVINGKRLSETKKVPLTWPNFTFEFSDMFQVHVFTMPSSIQLEFIVVDGLREIEVDLIDVEVPGQHVKALTCACQLVQQLEFSQLARQNKKIANKFKAASTKPEGILSEADKVKLALEQKKKEEKEQIAIAGDIKGVAFAKAEWKGYGPKMPPIKSENLFKKAKATKNRKQYTELEQTMLLLKQLYIDVNDPRNERIIKILRDTKNDYILRLLYEDSKNSLSDLKPFRHKLLLAREKDPSFGRVFIPALESELIDSARCGFYLEKLESLFRSEAYAAHLDFRLKEEQERQEKRRQGEIGDDLEDEYMGQMLDVDTLRRRTKIVDAVKERITGKNTKDKQNSESNHYKSIVKEVEIEHANPFIAILNKFFQGGRKLKPLVRKQQTVNIESVSEAKIYVHCIKGENVPVRYDYIKQAQEFLFNKSKAEKERLGAISTQPQNSNMEVSKKQIFEKKQVESFVEVTLQYTDKPSVVKRTNVDEGHTPKWNEVLVFMLKSTNHTSFTKEELISNLSMITIALFDKERYYEKPEGEGMTIIREENRFLGRIEIPLQTILLNPRKTEFNFRLERPVCLPTYRVLTEEVYFMKNETDVMDAKLRENEQASTYINISISLEPVIQLPSENSLDYYSGYENHDLLKQATDWMNSIRTKKKAFEHNNVRVFGENLAGQSVLLCRYLTPIMPPESVADLNRPGGKSAAISACARFVSLIPFVTDTAMFKDMPDLYCTNQQFLDLGGGDHEEHAILLACYFMYIDSKGADAGRNQTYLAYGHAMPEGQITYVMRTDGVDVELWSPVTGMCYFFEKNKTISKILGCIPDSEAAYMTVRSNDPICPLTQIHALVSDKDIYANIQASDHPTMINYDVTNKKQWSSLFSNLDKNLLRLFPGGKIQTVQLPTLSYAVPPDESRQLILAKKIQKYLMEEFADERVRVVRKTTKWALSAETALKLVLIDFENNVKLSRQSKLGELNKNPDVDPKLGQIMTGLQQVAAQQKSKRVWGFPINFTFCTFDQLWEKVKATQMHAVNRQDVEFALVVHIVPYPANVMSVWIYLAAFIDKTLDELVA